jgi:hypothetical protein
VSLKFKPDDFKGKFPRLPFPGEPMTLEKWISLCERVASTIANKKLQEWLDEAPTVWKHEVCEDPEGGTTYEVWEESNLQIGFSLKAKLVCIEELSTSESEEE